ncbi:MAG: hypothetical protein IJX99_01280 [Clostridia bacterium]|nr:hypothetical protein [Clostridia bacterium]
MQTTQEEVMTTTTPESTGADITLKGVIKVARKVLSDEENFKLHQMFTVWGDREMLTKAIAFVSKRHPMTMADWIAELSA